MKLELRELTKSYAGRPVLDGVSADIAFPHVLALLGPSGGGKSTLLRLIGGLERADRGSVSIDGVSVPDNEPARRRYRASIGTVFQSWNLFPHLDALANVMLPLMAVHGCADGEARDRAEAILSRLHLSGHEHKRPAELSGGQRQRVAIARAVAIKPKLLLFDEPTSALDPEMTAEVLEVIADLKREGRTFVLVTHATNFARRVADQIAFVSGGKILEHGDAETFFNAPTAPEAQRYLERVLRY